MTRTKSILVCALLLAPALAGCDEPVSPPLEAEASPARMDVAPPAPAPLETVAMGADELTFWPYIGTSLDGVPSDPVNLIFTGLADPRNIRDALMSLDGVRPEPFSAFSCTWTDAIGGIQATYAEGEGWTGSVIQLECGTYQTVRFHLRLFPAGERTLANAHVDVLIPGTTDHQVLTWETAEQFILFELARGGLLGAPPAQTAAITGAPTFRSIPPVIYNGLPAALRALTGGPLAGSVSEPVGIPNDGAATILAVGVDAPAAGGTTQAITVPFGQVVPKPFCGEPGDLVRVDGPVEVWQEVTVTEDGELLSQTFADGDLQVRSFDPVTATLGEAIPAKIRDQYGTRVSDGEDAVRSRRHQLLVPAEGATQQLQVWLQIGPGVHADARSAEHCG